MLHELLVSLAALLALHTNNGCSTIIERQYRKASYINQQRHEMR